MDVGANGGRVLGITFMDELLVDDVGDFDVDVSVVEEGALMGSCYFHSSFQEGIYPREYLTQCLANLRFERNEIS